MTIFLVFGNAYAEEMKELASQREELAEAFEFIKSNMIGKTLISAEETHTIDNGRMEAVFGAEFSYSNLNMTEEKSAGGKSVTKGLTYDEKTNIKHTNYKLDSKGKRIEPGENRDRETRRRYLITQRKSTGELIGVSLSLDENGEIKNSPYTGVNKIEIKDGKLVKEYKQLYLTTVFRAIQRPVINHARQSL